MIRSNLYDYSDAYVHFKGTITIPNTKTAAAPDNRNKKVIFKNCAPFTNCISEINNNQVDGAHDIDVEMLMYNLIQYSDIYSKTSGRLWQYYKDEPALDSTNNIIDFLADKNSISFNSKTRNNGTKDVETMVPLKHLSNFWRTLEMPLNNCEISKMLTWSKNCFLNAKLYVPFLTLSTQHNVKLLKQLESSFKRIINWNKYQSKITERTQNRYLDFLIDPSFQGVNRLFVSSFEDKND